MSKREYYHTHRRRSSSLFSSGDEIDPYSSLDIYYGPSTNPSTLGLNSKIGRTRTMSTVENKFNPSWLMSSGAEGGNSYDNGRLKRRLSTDDKVNSNRRFFIADIDATLRELLESEDSDRNMQITIEDTGPKVLQLGTLNSNGYNQLDIRGTYMLSNLLQELTIAKRFGRNQMILDEVRLNENPVKRLRRLIVDQFWKSLTRQLDDTNIGVMLHDTKIHTPELKFPRIYIPHTEHDQFEYFEKVKSLNPQLNLQVEYLPENITLDWVKSINHKPGLLLLLMHKDSDGHLSLYKYIVPGGRFNELYGWDSYMETIGLLVDFDKEESASLNRLELARGMVEHFIFEIKHYGKILNLNRSYYLCRSQPPFLTDMLWRVFEKLQEVEDEEGESHEESLDFLRRALILAIKEYNTVWCALPRFDPASGLSCYHPDGKGIPPETELTHFTLLLAPYCKKYNVTFEEFQRLYNNEEIHEPELDLYFLHDRAVRESGHDTSYRLEGHCADLLTVDLNSLLYKYETDILRIIRDYFGGELNYDGEGKPETLMTPDAWLSKLALRKLLMNKYCWNEELGMFFDYNVVKKQQENYESLTTFWTMWLGLCSEKQAERLLKSLINKFEELGGLVAGTLKSRGDVGLDRPSRQWDYPFGWLPQQILLWIGLTNYGYDEVLRRICYRWLYLMTKLFVDYNGIVVEKYDVTRGSDPHRVDLEYGNQGLDFKGVATEGFGWVNASFVFGLTFCDKLLIRLLGTVTPPDVFFSNLRVDERKQYGI